MLQQPRSTVDDGPDPTEDPMRTIETHMYRVYIAADRVHNTPWAPDVVAALEALEGGTRV